MIHTRFRFYLTVVTLILSGCAAKTGPSVEPSVDAHPVEVATGGDVLPARSVTRPAGVYLAFERGMTLYRISKKYDVSVETLMAANGITDPTSIPAGALIFVPGATGPAPRAGSAHAPHARFDWPLRGRITSPFGATGRRRHHTGIDIDGEEGDPILAAADGRVERVVNDPKYGRLVIVAHGGGYATWYAHASEVLVVEGDPIEQGQEIARVGS